VVAKRDEAYRAWIRGKRCIIEGATTLDLRAHHCYGGVQACHVISRGAGGADHRNLYPGCAVAHTEQHAIGIKSFEDRWRLSLAEAATYLWERYQQEGTSPAPETP